MGRYTTAYSSFVSRMDEVVFFQKSAATKEKNDPIKYRHEINAFCRAAIVLLSAHFEAYIKEIGEITLTNIHYKSVLRDGIASQLYYHISKNYLDEIMDTSKPEKIAEKIFVFIDADLPYWSKRGPFPKPLPIDRFNKGFSNPAFDKIKAYFNRFGYSLYERDLASHLKANYSATVNMVNHLVDMRNKIAHGSLGATKTPSEVKDMISTIQVFCKTTDFVFASWCKGNICAIR